VRQLGIVLGALAVFATAASARPSALHLVTVGRFSAPVYATSAPGEPSNLYVVEQGGRILVVANGTTRATPFLDIRPLVRSGGEQGLLSVAFDPSYASNHFFYVDYTDRNGDTRVLRYRASGGRALPSSARQLVFVKDFAPNHNGGQLQFGPDRLLYWGNGDGGGGGDPQHNGQSLARPFAKIMRTNPRVAKPFWRLVAYGLRNPWRFSFDRANGDLYIGDVGQDNYEEIDYLKRGSGISNFGWNHYEGLHVYDASTPLSSRGGYHPPVVEYPHAQGCSVTGGYVYRGKAIASAAGRYFYGDYCSGTIWSLKIAGGNARSVRVEPIKVDGLSSFGEDSSGELYVMSVASGELARIAG
jgi:glucose/arabinose dehydrogenase